MLSVDNSVLKFSQLPAVLSKKAPIQIRNVIRCWCRLNLIPEINCYNNDIVRYHRTQRQNNFLVPYIITRYFCPK